MLRLLMKACKRAKHPEQMVGSHGNLMAGCLRGYKKTILVKEQIHSFLKRTIEIALL